MKLKILYLLLLIPTLGVMAQGPRSVISVHADDMSFPGFAEMIYSKSGVRIFYQEEWVQKINVHMDEDSISVWDAVRKVTSEYGLRPSLWNDHIVLLPHEELISSLPDFRIKESAAPEVPQKSDSLTLSEERYLKGRRADVPEVFTIGSREKARGRQPVKILGRILDKQTGEPLIGATAYVEETGKGAVTDKDGYFTLVIRPGRYNIRLESIGYEKKKSLFNIESAGRITIELPRSLIPLQEVVVMGDRQKSNLKRDPGLQNIPLQTLREMPMLMGERDLIRLTELLPGIVSIGEGSAGINVRGGSSDQNAFYINKIPVYNTSHLFGFFPAFNSDIIRDFNVYKGYIPARFGGRLSSVFNMISRNGNRREFRARGAINPVSANLTVEGPLIKDACSFLISGRMSYSDWILRQINDHDISNSSARFNDVSAALNYDWKKNQLSLFVYHSYDHFNLSDLNVYEYSNDGISLNYRRNIKPGLHMDMALITSAYSFQTVDRQLETKAYSHDYQIRHNEFRTDVKHVLNSKHTLEYGIDAILYDLDRGEVLPWGEESLRVPLNLGKDRGLEAAAFISDNYDISSRLQLNIGLRYMAYTALGPEEVYLYPPDVARDERYISDTLKFGTNESTKWYNYPEIRAALNINTGLHSSVKLAFNQMHQDLFMLNTTVSVAPNTQWQLAGYHLAPSASNQLSAGYFRNFMGGILESSVEVFGKTTSNYPEFKDGADFLNNRLVETNVLQGDQWSYGVEFFLERKKRRLGGWISYTWSRSLVQIDGDESYQKINEGNIYPSSFDIPHVVNAVLNYHFTRRVILSAVFAYRSGRPVTYPVSVYYIDRIPYTEYSGRNEYRIPDYFRMDMSLTIEGSLRRNKPLHSTLLFNVYNLTGRNNPYSVFFRTEENRIKSYKYSVIGVPVFTVTWMFKLGNYASE